MRCPNCGSMDDKVLESRTMANGESIRRRRECLKCSFRFTSYERIDEKPFMVVKREGRRQPFDSTKLGKGIERALEKRPVSTTTVEQITSDIEDSAIKMAKEAREEGFNEIARKFEMVGKIEKDHEERYRKLLKNVEEGLVFSRDGDAIWQCSNCGHIVIGKKAPAICPVCNHPQSYFEIKKENY